ncbi:hypothetical protein BD560DRAFT_406302 [Blakeslea trispora]|nr:hypothetical protein BD560DRAFT_406302 [Blakeslea trispora]
MISSSIYSLDPIKTQQLLERLDDWRKGICPNGKLAEQNSFVLQQRPSITIHPEPTLMPVTTELITEQAWDGNLVACSVITHLNDDAMMETLAYLYMIFHASDHPSHHTNTLHTIHTRKHASFRMDQVSRPTRALQQRLDQLTAGMDSEAQWDLLINIWHTFGFLWPRKIVLGYKITKSRTYTFDHPVDSINKFYSHLDLLKDEIDSLMHDRQHHPYQLAPFQLESLIEHGDIVARMDLDPLHLFLDPKTSKLIHDMIYHRFVQVTVYQPIKLYNACTDSYLCWDPKKSQDTVIEENESFDFLVRAVPRQQRLASSGTQYLWRLMRTPMTHQPSFSSPPLAISGSERVFIYPACRSSPVLERSGFDSTSPWQLKDRFMIDTHTMALSCRPYLDEPDEQQRDFSKFRGLRLLSSDKLDSFQEASMVDWTIEYPHNHLKYMTETQANIKLNFHEHVRSHKPLIDGDSVQLQQIGLLTVFDPVNKSSHTKHRSNKKNVLCVDEDLTKDRWAEKTYWKLELADKADMKYHQSTFCSWPPIPPSVSHQGR